MNILTGVIHSGKTTALETALIPYISWDLWLREYLGKPEAKTELGSLIPDLYFDIPFFITRYIALHDEIQIELCLRLAKSFRDEYVRRKCKIAEIPLYALRALQRQGDTTIAWNAPDDDVLIQRYINVRQCTEAEAKQFIGQVHKMMSAVDPDHIAQTSNDLLAII